MGTLHCNLWHRRRFNSYDIKRIFNWIAILVHINEYMHVYKVLFLKRQLTDNVFKNGTLFCPNILFVFQLIITCRIPENLVKIVHINLKCIVCHQRLCGILYCGCIILIWIKWNSILLVIYLRYTTWIHQRDGNKGAICLINQWSTWFDGISISEDKCCMMLKFFFVFWSLSIPFYIVFDTHALKHTK